MKKYLLTGLLTLLPLALTIMIVVYIFDLFSAPFVGLVEDAILYYESKHQALAQRDALIIFLSRVIAFFLFLLLTLLLGVIGRATFHRWANKLLSRIPIVKTIYRLSSEVTSAVFSQDKKTFQQTVLIPFPFPHTHALGFITGEVPEGLKKVLAQAEVTVFVPTAPHPVSGFMLLTAKKEALPVDIKTEDAFKFLLSCGVIHPQEASKSKSS